MNLLNLMRFVHYVAVLHPKQPTMSMKNNTLEKKLMSQMISLYNKVKTPCITSLIQPFMKPSITFLFAKMQITHALLSLIDKKSLTLYAKS